MRRARTLNQSSQDVGIVSCRIEQPIRAVLQDQPSDGSAGVSHARPPTFRRGGHGPRQRGSVALTIAAATGGGGEPAIEAIGEAVTSHEPTHQAECQKASKNVCPGHVHGYARNNLRGVPCHRITGRDPPSNRDPRMAENRTSRLLMPACSTYGGPTDRPIRGPFLASCVQRER